MSRVSLICLAALAPAFAMADIVPAGIGITGAGPYVRSYNLQLAADQGVVAGSIPPRTTVSNDPLDGYGSLITIYDFDGYFEGSCAGPTGWTCTTPLIGITPVNAVPRDNPGIVDLAWVYTSGSTPAGPSSGLDLGTVTAHSIDGTITTVSYASRDVENTGSQAGSIGNNAGNTQGPTAGTAIPEPGSLALAGLGLLGLGLVRRRNCA